ncbi:hypothetical protein SAMN05443245_5195 [Paraburkholderia fungorum]|uniref:Uncharacterized protein n=1 Tax=Paraburkholderia fungorum TaxID=134537 RepID=A0A1H1IHH3_9BURK|nr:hypothetical protein [Paraburkholderia fungorum]SDR37197.1 hypothetical protein SAMN05443245_5195 [Paraburkholderia fungorum]
MSEIKHTAGPYERVGTTVFALQHYGWRKGEEQFCNRVYANVQAGPGCSPKEAEAVAMLFQAAPELLDLLIKARRYVGLVPCDAVPSDDPIYGVMDDIDAAIAKATGSQS